MYICIQLNCDLCTYNFCFYCSFNCKNECLKYHANVYTTDCTLDVVRDVVFLIDTSSSIGSVRFQRVKEVVNNVTVNLKLNSPESLVSIILFDKFAHIYFNLEANVSLVNLSLAINQIPYTGGSNSNTADALQLLLRSTQNGVLGISNETSNIAVLITDGPASRRSSSQLADIEFYARELHKAGVYDIYAVGYGRADLEELSTIASGQEYVYTVSFYSQSLAEDLQMNLTDQICSSKYHNNTNNDILLLNI